MTARTLRLRAFLVAGLVAAACGGCAAAGGGQLTATGTTVSYQGYGRTAVVSADGRTITVGGFGGGYCSTTVTAVARENDTTVALFLQTVAASGPQSCPHAMAALIVAQNIKLTEPLGDRKLVDGATGRPVAWVSGRFVLLPTALPPGYPLSDLTPAGTFRSTPTGTPAGCVQVYQSRGNPDDVVITQSTGSTGSTGSTRLQAGPGGWIHIQVRGHPGLASRNVITWQENGLTDVISAGAAPSPGGPRVLSTRQLITIAESAPTYNTKPLPVPGR